MGDLQTGYDAALVKGGTGIGHVRNISGPDCKVGDVDFTTLSSADRTKEYKPGLVDPGALTAECLFKADDGGQSAFLTDMYAGTIAAWSLTWGDGTIASFSGYPNAHSVNTGGPEDPVTANIGIKLTGKVSYVAGSGV